jgi:hypothetical protein
MIDPAETRESGRLRRSVPYVEVRGEHSTLLIGERSQHGRDAATALCFTHLHLQRKIRVCMVNVSKRSDFSAEAGQGLALSLLIGAFSAAQVSVVVFGLITELSCMSQSTVPRGIHVWRYSIALLTISHSHRLRLFLSAFRLRHPEHYGMRHLPAYYQDLATLQHIYSLAVNPKPTSATTKEWS